MKSLLLLLNWLSSRGKASQSTAAQRESDSLAQVSPEEDTPDPVPSNPGPVDLSFSIFDMSERQIVETITNGETVDFGDSDISRYAIAVEASGPVSSFILEYEGETWTQNIFPYTLEDPRVDLSAGTFQITVTAYSELNGTGTVLGTESVSFSTTSAEPTASETPSEPVNQTPPPADEPAEEPVDQTPPPVDEPVEEPVDQTPPPADEPVEEPVDQTPPPVDEPVEEPPVLVDDSPSAPTQSGSGEPGGTIAATPIDGTVQVIGGRVTTLDPQIEDVQALKIISDLDHGNVTVNPDGTFAVVLTLSESVADQSFTYEATHSNGTTSTHTVNLDVVAGPQADGWATGADHYMLATDESGAVVVEAGDVHTKVYVSGSTNALSISEIAAQEGISTSQVTGKFLADNGYGQSEELALSFSAGKTLWNYVSPDGSQNSNWLLLERGYEYGDIDGMIGGLTGESELHPVYVTSWGEGAKPVVQENFKIVGQTKNVVIQDVHFDDGVQILYTENMIFDNITVRNDQMSIWDSESTTVRNSDFVDITLESSRNGGDWLEPHADRIQGLFANKGNGLLLENNLFDHNGWADDYAENGDGNSGQPPSQHNHNIYIGAEASDVTVRDTITMQASSFGMQVRPGGFVEDNVFIDNNAALTTVGGNYQDAGFLGNYTLINGNLVTSAGYKHADNKIGAKAWGMIDNARMTTLVDNIVAHLADPDNPEEQAEKNITQTSVNSNGTRFYDDTLIHNWSAEINNQKAIEDKNTEGLDQAVLDDTTIQNFAAQLLGDPNATIADLGDFLQAQAEADGVDVITADTILQYFREGFGIAVDERTAAETARFIPDDLGDGVRWDNRLNWSTEDLPGTVTGDSVHLGGNHVIYNGLTTEIDEMEFGPGGRLDLYGGKLTATGGLATNEGSGDVVLNDSGQLWTEGHSGSDLDVWVNEDARFANTGNATDASLTVNGGDAILATGGAIWGVSTGETLAVNSNSADIGFDDDDGGVGLLVFEEGATLSYGTKNGQLGTIEEVDTGAFETSDVRSGADLGNATLNIDLTGLTAANGEDLMLLDADEIIGAFADTDVSGLGARNATITIDYLNDSVSMVLSSGSGQVSFETVGLETDVSDGEDTLWQALTEGQGVFSEAPPALPESEEEYLLAS